MASLVTIACAKPSLLLTLMGPTKSLTHMPLALGACHIQNLHSTSAVCGDHDRRTAKGKRRLGTYGKWRATPSEKLQRKLWYNPTPISQIVFKLPEQGRLQGLKRDPYVVPDDWKDRFTTTTSK